MTSIKFPDKHLLGLLIGITMVKLLRGECNIKRRVRRSVNAVKIDFVILKNFGENFSDGGFMWKDVNKKNEHFHFFPKNDKLGMGVVITDESKKYPHPERHIPIDHEKFFAVFGDEVHSYFKEHQQILDLNTNKFDKLRVISYKPEVNFDKIKKKILYLNLEPNEKETSFDDFKHCDDALAIIIDNAGNLVEFIVKKADKIHCFNFEALKNISKELFPVVQENYKNSAL